MEAASNVGVPTCLKHDRRTGTTDKSYENRRRVAKKRLSTVRVAARSL